MPSIIDTLKKKASDAIAKKTAYNYKVGTKDSGGGIPFSVKLSIDEDFKKAVIKSVTIFSIGVGAGIAAGIVIRKVKK